LDAIATVGAPDPIRESCVRGLKMQLQVRFIWSEKNGDRIAFLTYLENLLFCMEEH
jgi:hypothetical protein